MKPKTSFDPGEAFSLRNPERTLLGTRLVACAIELLDRDGFESLTFRRLAAQVPTTEASIYRYFEHKYQLLRYLVAWYWEWLCHRLEQELFQLASPRQQLRRALEILADSSRYDPGFAHVDEAALCRIVIRESAKIYLTEAQPEGFFPAYLRLCDRLAGILLELRPHFDQPRALASTLIETAHRQLLFAQALPMLTELRPGEGGSMADFLERLALAMLAFSVAE